MTGILKSDIFWSSFTLAQVVEILSSDDLPLNEFHIAELALTWLTRNYCLVKSSALPNILTPIQCNFKLEYADKVLDCLRVSGTSFFYNWMFLKPWFIKLGVPVDDLENEDFDEPPDGNPLIHLRNVPQSRIFGFADICIDSCSLPLTSMLMLQEGRYEIEEPCYYCCDEMITESNGGPVSFDHPKVTISIEVASPGTDCPVKISGHCNATTDSFHRIEHANVLPTSLSEVTLHDEFCGLYCTSYYSLSRYFERLRSLKGGAKLSLFYSRVPISTSEES